MKKATGKGFTLVEALIASAFFFMAISMTVSAFMAGTRNFRHSQDSIRACHDCTTILTMITGEIMEADPSTVTITPSKDSITFAKYHHPTGNTQTVTWRLDSTLKKVVREYTAACGATHSAPVGEHVASLCFEKEINSTNNRIRIITTLRISADGQSAKAFELSREVTPRRDQTVEIQVNFNSPR